MTKNGLLSIVLPAIVVTAMGVGLVKSLVDGYYDNLPGVVYMIDGKPVIERKFKTNEEFQKYLNSEKGKKEAEYYASLNK